MITRGSVISAGGGVIAARLPAVSVGEGVRIGGARGDIAGVVTAVEQHRALIAAHDAVDGVAAGDTVWCDPAALTMPLGTAMLGRVFDARGIALDEGSAPAGRAKNIAVAAPLPSQRRAVGAPFWTGIRCIDALLTIGRGARIGVFGPPGCGKSTLLHLLMRGAYADAVVVGLVGERGREAQEWTRSCPRHASMVCATSDRSAAERVHAARVAMAQADALRSRGLHVLLILDSLARFAAALREVALASGQSVGRGGYPPSVFADLARLVEVPGNARRGSITLLATVLSDGDERDPVSEAARSLLDGHIALSPKLAQAGRFPAIDLPGSTSRTMSQVVDAAHEADARLVRGALAALAQTEDARSLGIMPADPFTVRAMAAEEQLEALLRQGKLPVPPAQSLSALAAAADILK
ncbi:MAG TPA: ATP-binding cassette domain-containing protein [Candidatus Baltobacteraceae bacterium]|nr:ATP-binding cassette domain-containing protein [Candidatus Baltobacteraceae bacterium]